MVALWMCYATVVTALLAVGAWAADGALAVLGRQRRWAWAAAIAGGVALPAWAGWRAARPVQGEVAMPSTVQALDVARGNARAVNVAGQAVGSGAVVAPAPLPSRVADLRDRAERATVSATRALAPYDRPLLAAWLLASAAGLASVVQGAWAVRHRRRDWRTTVLAGERVWIAPDLGPALVGALRPRIVLPTWIVDALDLDDLRLVLAHERAHASARDPLLLAVALGAVVAAPWNVALWLAARRLRLAAEGDCDRRVLRAHPGVRRYARILVDVAERALGAPDVRAVRTIATALLDPPGLLERRVAWLLGVERCTPRWGTARVAGAVVGTLGVAVLACAVPRPVPAPAPVARGTDTSAIHTSAIDTSAIQLDVSPTCAARASCIAAELSAARAARSVDSMARALDRARTRLDTARLALAAARLDIAAPRAEMPSPGRMPDDSAAIRLYSAMASMAAHLKSVKATESARTRTMVDSIAVTQRAEPITDREQLDSAMGMVQGRADLRRSMTVAAGQFAALRAQFTALRAQRVQQPRVDSLFERMHSAGQALAHDPRAQAQFDSTVEALRTELRMRSATIHSAFDRVYPLPPIPPRPPTLAPDDTSPTSARRLHDLAREIAAREIAARTPHASGRYLTLFLFDSAGTVQRSVVRPLSPGEHVSLSTDDARRIFPELGRRPFSLGNMTWLAPNDSTYVVWVMPGHAR